MYCSNTSIRGGGVLSLQVYNKLYLDGRLSSNGARSIYGAGAGGSIRLTCNLMSGRGLVEANGGDIHRGIRLVRGRGGGSGGRIAVDTQNFLFLGVFTAIGGLGDEYLG